MRAAVLRAAIIAIILTSTIAGIRPQPQIARAAGGTVSGPLRVSQPLTIDFVGPTLTEISVGPNPFLDFRLQVTFTGPGGQVLSIPGYFDGNGQGGANGNIWRVRFTPDQAGTWSYQASFRSGTAIAVSDSPSAGTATAFDGAAGTITIGAVDPNAPDFLRWGRLEYANNHYLKFRNGPYWIKGGTDSPEAFLGYVGFDATPSGPYGLLDYVDHVGDWQTGNPVFNTNGPDGGKGIIGAINYLASQDVNSLFVLLMNIGGDGQNAFPFAGSINPGGSPANVNLHYDLSKIHQWETFFDYAQRQGIFLHFVLGETEKNNKIELDGAALGTERKLFYREMIARFGHHNAIQWNITEEYEHGYPLSPDLVKSYAGYIQQTDPYDHPITVHQNQAPDPAWLPFVGDSRFSITSFQLNLTDLNQYATTVEHWRDMTTASGRPIPIALDELNNLGITTAAADQQRREVIWPVYLSGGMVEHYLGEVTLDKTVDNFRPWEAVWTYMRIARHFMQDYLPFWEMEPADELLVGESTNKGEGDVFAKANEIYAIYLPHANPTGTIDLTSAQGSFELRWFNPRANTVDGTVRSINGGGTVSLGMPPNTATSDWAVLISRPGQNRIDPAFTQAANIGSDSATISWTTNQAGTSRVEYGLTSAYGMTSATSTTLKTSHVVHLTGLSPATTYHYRVITTNGSGYNVASEDHTFTTAPTSETLTLELRGVSEGQHVAGTVNIEAVVNGTNVTQVTFNLTGPTSEVWVDRIYPYYFLGDNPGGFPNGWDTTTYPDGTYTMTTTVQSQSGLTRTIVVNFVVDNTGGGGDTQPPAPPTNLTATGSTGGIALDWPDNSEADLAGYHVYRGTSSSGPFTRITTNHVSGSSYSDTSAPADATSHYQVTAIDISGNESARSEVAGAFRPGSTTSYQLAYSTVSNRANPGGLNGATVSGNIYVFTTPDTPDIVRVSFWLDNPSMSGTPRRTESGAPYDFNGGSTTVASAFNSATLANGTHSITARVERSNGTNEVLTAIFTVANGTADTTPPPVPSGLTASGSTNGIALDWGDVVATDLAGYHVYRGSSPSGPFARLTTNVITQSNHIDTAAPAGATSYYQVTAIDTSGNESAQSEMASALRPGLVYSTASNRSNPVDLSGATVSGNIFAFTTPDTADIVRVRFWLDNPAMTGAPFRNEGNAPYDFNGGTVTLAAAYNTANLSNGMHTITAAIERTGTATIVITATFAAQN